MLNLRSARSAGGVFELSSPGVDRKQVFDCVCVPQSEEGDEVSGGGLRPAARHHRHGLRLL